MRVTVVLVAVLLAIPARADEAMNLSGMTCLGVVIEDLKPEAIALGMSKSSLQTQVELRLRQTGIVVGEVAECPYVYLNAHIEQRGDLVVVGLTMDIQAWVTIKSNNRGTVAAVWNRGMLATVGKDSFADGMRSGVSDILDELLNDWLKANPKRP
jgi:hypothetical protein